MVIEACTFVLFFELSPARWAKVRLKGKKTSRKTNKYREAGRL